MPHIPNAASDQCRLCKQERESIWHWGECIALKPAYEVMREFDGGNHWNDKKLNLFGQYNSGKIIEPGISLIHFNLWKFILIQITQVSLHGKKFDVTEIIEFTRKRIKRKIETAKKSIRIIQVRQLARGNEKVRTPQFKKWIRGIGKIDNGKIVLHDALSNWLYNS